MAILTTTAYDAFSKVAGCVVDQAMGGQIPKPIEGRLVWLGLFRTMVILCSLAFLPRCLYLYAILRFSLLCTVLLCSFVSCHQVHVV